LAGCFTTWHESISENIRLRNVCSRVVKRMLMRQLAGCFTTWSLLVTEKIRLRNVCRRIMKRMLQRSLHNCYQQWSHNAQEQIMMRMFESKVVTKLRKRRLKHYYTTWHSTSLQQIKERSKTVRLDRILMQLRLKKKFTVLKHLFVVWRDRFVNVQKHQHRLKRNLLSRRHLCLVRCALRQWWRTARDQIHFNVTMQRFVYTIKSKLMKSYVFQWKMKTRWRREIARNASQQNAGEKRTSRDTKEKAGLTLDTLVDLLSELIVKNDRLAQTKMQQKRKETRKATHSPGSKHRPKSAVSPNRHSSRATSPRRGVTPAVSPSLKCQPWISSTSSSPSHSKVVKKHQEQFIQPYRFTPKIYDGREAKHTSFSTNHKQSGDGVLPLKVASRTDLLKHQIVQFLESISKK
jgi:hypothetical protein